MNSNLICIFINILILTIKINSQTLLPNEATCLNSFLNVLNIVNLPSDLCTVSGVTCKKDSTNSYKYVQSIYITQLSTTEIQASDIICLNNIENIYISNGYLNSDILSNQFYPSTFIYFSCYQCIIPSQLSLFRYPVAATFQGISLSNVNQANINFQLDFSTIKTLQSFEFTVSMDKIYTSNIVLNNDLVNGQGLTSTFPQSCTLTSVNLPSMKDLVGVGSLSFYSVNPYDYSNLTTYSQLKRIDFYVAGSTGDFPPFAQIPTPNNIEFIGSRANYNSVPNKIDLSNLLNLKEINLRDAYSFHSNGEIPFLPHPTLERFQLVGGISKDPKEFIISCPKLTSFRALYNTMKFDFSTWNYNQISRLTTLDLSNSQIYGTVDSSFCKIPEFNFRNCALNGTLPSCLSCYLTSSVISSALDNNKFTNFNPIPDCTTIIPNLWYSSSESMLYIYGQDIGLTSNDLKLASPYDSLVPTVVNRSSMFKIQMSLSILKPTFNVVFNAKSSSGLLNQTFTLSTSATSPIVNIITPSPSLNQLVFKGSFFSYNSSSIKITLGSSNCQVTSSTFSNINCILPNGFDFTQNRVVVYLSIDDNSLYDPLSTPPPALSNAFIINMNYENVLCSNGCGPNESCDQTNGTCICNAGYRGSPCEVIECPNNCSNAGTCVSGLCQCNSDRVNSDCSGYKCMDNCLNDGICDETIGKCKCTAGFTGSNCSIPLHYVTSIAPCTVDGGQVTLFGLFPDTAYTVTIGSLDCQIISKELNEIVCNLGPGGGIQSVKVINSNYNNLIFTGIGLFNYYNPFKSCPNNCTSLSNGICDSSLGTCSCLSDYIGFDCSIKKELIESAPVVNTTIDIKTASLQMNSRETIYKVGIISLSEISIDGSIVISHPLDNDNWVLLDSSSTNIYTFEQDIDQVSKITYTIEEIKEQQGKQFKFGSVSFIVPKDGIKISLNISNYQYQNSLNTLQLSFISGTNSVAQQNNQDSCNDKDTLLDTSNADNQNDVNYISIYKNSRQLLGRFINMVISDGKETFMSSTFNKSNNNNQSSIIINANLPHCKYSCLIDPDFSLLVTSDFSLKCSSSSKNWVIPVAVVIPCVVVSSIVIVSIILFRKHRYSLKIISFKLKNLSKR